jgi:hypothetical protein
MCTFVQYVMANAYALLFWQIGCCLVGERGAVSAWSIAVASVASNHITGAVFKSGLRREKATGANTGVPCRSGGAHRGGAIKGLRTRWWSQKVIRQAVLVASKCVTCQKQVVIKTCSNRRAVFGDFLT